MATPLAIPPEPRSALNRPMPAALMRSGMARTASARGGRPLTRMATDSATRTIALVTASMVTKSPSITTKPAAMRASGCVRESGAFGSATSGARSLMPHVPRAG